MQYSKSTEWFDACKNTVNLFFSADFFEWQ